MSLKDYYKNELPSSPLKILLLFRNHSRWTVRTSVLVICWRMQIKLQRKTTTCILRHIEHKRSWIIYAAYRLTWTCDCTLRYWGTVAILTPQRHCTRTATKAQVTKWCPESYKLKSQGVYSFSLNTISELTSYYGITRRCGSGKI